MSEKYSMKSLVLDYVSNWGGNYIGINFIEFYDENGDAITVLIDDIESCYTSKTPENPGTNAVVTAVKTTQAHFSGSSAQRIVINFLEPIDFTTAHVWNYSYLSSTFSNSVKDFKVSISDESQVEGVATLETELSGSGFVLFEGTLTNVVTEQSIELNEIPGTISGIIKANGVFAARTVRAYLRSDGSLVDEVVSDSETGEFSLSVVSGVLHYVVILDDDLDENAIIYDLITPV